MRRRGGRTRAVRVCRAGVRTCDGWRVGVWSWIWCWCFRVVCYAASPSGCGSGRAGLVFDGGEEGGDAVVVGASRVKRFADDAAWVIGEVAAGAIVVRVGVRDRRTRACGMAVGQR